MMRKEMKILVAYSGGKDSSAMAWWAVGLGHHVSLVMCDNGYMSPVALANGRLLARKLGCRFVVIPIYCGDVYERGWKEFLHGAEAWKCICTPCQTRMMEAIQRYGVEVGADETWHAMQDRQVEVMGIEARGGGGLRFPFVGRGRLGEEVLREFLARGLIPRWRMWSVVTNCWWNWRVALKRPRVYGDYLRARV